MACDDNIFHSNFPLDPDYKVFARIGRSKIHGVSVLAKLRPVIVMSQSLEDDTYLVMAPEG
jgi:hypothetical protein